MLSYRHAFHAGNFADVLKHTVLLECLNYMQLKEKPFIYLDTHAGPGSYELDSDFAQKNREYESGISQLWQMEALPETLRNYRDAVSAFNTDSLQKYPGSPALAAQSLRAQDRLCFCELHKTEYRQLHTLFQNDRRVETWLQDGFVRVLKQLPPQERRAVILIDPPYELKEDYPRVVEFATACHRKFPQGVYLFWYPVVERSRIDQMEAAFRDSGIPNIELFEYGVLPDTEARGMTASGMIVINPPWTLREQIEPALVYLTKTLNKTGNAFYRALTLCHE